MKLSHHKLLKVVLFITIFWLDNPLYAKFPNSSYFTDSFLKIMEKCTALITAPLKTAHSLDKLNDFYNRAENWQNWWDKKEKKYESKVETPLKAAKLLQNAIHNLKFLGASTSHYQIEGGYDLVLDQHGNPADLIEKYAQDFNKKNSDDKEKNKDLPRTLSSGKSIDFWNNYKTIIPKLKQELNINMLRISIGWSRVQPDQNYFDKKAIDRYVNIVKTLKENNIEPLVTFHHYTNPVWFQELGGFANAENIHYFVAFCTEMYEALASYVQYYSTMNGSESYAFRAYFAKETPPYEKSLQKTMEVQCNILEAHVQIYEAIKNKYKELQEFYELLPEFEKFLEDNPTEDFVKELKWKKTENYPKIQEPLIGIQKNVHPIDVAKKTLKQKLLLPLSTAATYFGNKIQNDGFDGFFTNGIFSIHIPSICSVYHENKKAPHCLDWIGINCYANRLMTGTKQIREVSEKLRSESGHYYACPWIIYRATMQVYDSIVAPILEKYEKLVPIIITENGLATKNEKQREWYYKQIAIALHLVTKHGYPVIGYLPWTAIDCFEWRSGLTHNYGLVAARFAGSHTDGFLDKYYTTDDHSDKPSKYHDGPILQHPYVEKVKPGAQFYADFIKYASVDVKTSSVS